MALSPGCIVNFHNDGLNRGVRRIVAIIEAGRVKTIAQISQMGQQTNRTVRSTAQSVFNNIRHGLNASPGMLSHDHGDNFANRFGLGFSAEDREENIRRIGAVAEIFAQTGSIALTAFISPYRIDRDRVRNTLKQGEFIEVFVDTPIEICEQRDPKGLYKKARAGEIKGFTGIDDPYEAPVDAELVLLAGEKTPDTLADEVIAYLKNNNIIGV